MSGSAQLRAIKTDTPSSWRAALDGALREEFRASPLALPEGSPLLPPTCGVDGCPRPGDRTAWGRSDTRLCHAHWKQWVQDERPVAKDAWLSTQGPPVVLRSVIRCAVRGCSPSAATTGLCGSHRRQWSGAGRPELEGFVRSAGPTAAAGALCLAPGCGFPAVAGRHFHGLCDRHLARFHAWRHKHVHDGDRDASVEHYVESLRFVSPTRT